jgi:DNA mismatch endonuclease, patch repair protein
MDRLTPEKRSWNMSRIRSKNTKPEKAVRSLLHKSGYRFRIHRKDLPGNPDIVLPKFKTVVFVHGCFWHRHENCKYAYTPKSRQEFWKKKFEVNIKRDLKNRNELECLGWKVVIIWECELKNLTFVKDKIESFLKKNTGQAFISTEMDKSL